MPFPQIPYDIYVHILAQLQPCRSRDDLAAKTILHCTEANSNLRSAATLPVLWESHYRTRYIHCDPRREAARREASGGDWRLMYVERRRIDKQVLDILDATVEESTGRHDHARKLTQEFAYDAWDSLELESQCRLPDNFRDSDDSEDPVPDETIAPHAVTRRFWAKAMLGLITRHNAIGVWSNLMPAEGASPAQAEVSLEDAFSGLSAFFGVSPKQLSSTLNGIFLRCKSHLLAQNLCLDSEDPSYDLTELCISICAFMRSEGFDSVVPNNFHDIHNHFPHFYLHSHRKTIPLPLVAVFVSIAGRLGIQASPVDFPAKVIAHVSSPDPNTPDIYVDVYASAARPILSVRNDLMQLLMNAGVAPPTVGRHIAPTSAAPMLLRAARNILQSYRLIYVQADARPAEAITQPAVYAALCASLLLTNDPRLCAPMLDYISAFPLDVAAVLLDRFSPCLQPASQSTLKQVCLSALADDEHEALTTHRRSPHSVRFFVGLVFQHLHHGYKGVVIGWDPTCLATPEWITSMGVDSLSRGRHQPFYHVIADVGPKRYVAEENIRPINVPRLAPAEFLNEFPTFGRYFEDVFVSEEDHGRGRMLMSPELRTRYPEDDAVGERWVKEGVTDVLP
ncbi:hypothetical protein PLICRDRAFT_171762 [Plicaturopsis crispa FD-325 SS-3]|nr:hypothetical protein PLICRDRAFT_171762 [Plicaturopsis crispa FD-325 SS-3]